MFGIELVCAKLEEHRNLPPREAIDLLYDLVREWQGSDDPADDQTIVLAAPKLGGPLPPLPDEA